MVNYEFTLMVYMSGVPLFCRQSCERFLPRDIQDTSCSQLNQSFDVLMLWPTDEKEIYIYIYNEALLYPCILKVAHVCDENKPFRSSWSSWLATVLQGDAPPAAAKNRQLSHCTNSSCSMRQAGKQGSTKCDQYATLRVKTSIRSEK